MADETGLNTVQVRGYLPRCKDVMIRAIPLEERTSSTTTANATATSRDVKI